MQTFQQFAHITRCLCCLACFCLTGCIFGYYAPAPDGYRGDFVLASKATIDSCDIGPGLWSGSTPAICIYPGECTCDQGTILPAGTPVKVLHEFVFEGTDVSLRVGSGAKSKVVHTRRWEQVKQILQRPGSDVKSKLP
jgi:hypothetical protein